MYCYFFALFLDLFHKKWVLDLFVKSKTKLSLFKFYLVKILLKRIQISIGQHSWLVFWVSKSEKLKLKCTDSDHSKSIVFKSLDGTSYKEKISASNKG